MPSRGQKFNIIIVKSEMVLDFHHDFRLFGFFFQCILSFWCGAKFLGVHRRCPSGSRKVVLCLSCLHSRDDRTTSSEISLLPWNFPLPELDPKSRLLTITIRFLKILLEGKMEHDSLGRTSGKFPGRTKHPQLGTRLLGWGGGGGRGGGKGKNRDKQDKYRWAKRSQRLSGVSLLRSPIFFPFSPNAEPGPRLKHPKR